MGMSYEEFTHATLRQIDNRFRGWQKLQEQHNQAEMERLRWQTLWLISPHIKKGKMPAIHRQMRFPWEKEKAPEFQGDVLEVLAKWDRKPIKK